MRPTSLLAIALLSSSLSACAREADRGSVASVAPPAASASAPKVVADAPAHSAPRPASASPEGAWSPVADGLSARFIATRTGSNVRLEIELRASAPVDIGWGTFGQMLRFDATDGSGAPLPFDAVGGNEAAALPAWRTFRAGETARFVVTERALEHVTPARTLLRPVTFQAWELGARDGAGVRLGAKLSSAPVSGAAAHPFRGPLVIPPVVLP